MYLKKYFSPCQKPGVSDSECTYSAQAAQDRGRGTPRSSGSVLQQKVGQTGGRQWGAELLRFTSAGDEKNRKNNFSPCQVPSVSDSECTYTQMRLRIAAAAHHERRTVWSSMSWLAGRVAAGANFYGPHLAEAEKIE